MKHNNHPRITKAHKDHDATLSPIERVGVWASDHLATWQCLTLFTIIGALSLIGALWGINLLTFVFGALSSYFIQLVSLSVIGIGQKVEAQRGSHVQAEILKDLEWIKDQLFDVAESVDDLADEQGTIHKKVSTIKQFEKATAKAAKEIAKSTTPAKE